MTAAGLAYTNWRHKFMPAGVVIDTNKEAREVERDGYYGGQISCWFRGEVVDDSDPVADAIHRKLDIRTHTIREAVYELDITSLYPSVMRRNQYPCELVSVLRFPTVDDLFQLSQEYSCIASVTLRAMREGFPYRSGDTLVFPEGVYTTTLCHPELVRALERNQVTHCHRLCLYNTTDLFTPFVNHWWAKRRRSKLSRNVVREELCKLMMNSLFGKFGQRKPVWRQRPDCRPPEPWRLWAGPRLNGRGLVRHRSVGWDDYELACEEYSDDAFPAISAFVTSYAREYMRVIRSHLPPFTCLYQHTDSLVVTKAGLDVISGLGLVRENQLGLFKPPVKITHAVFRGPNNVTVNQTDKVSGVGQGAHKLGDGRWLVERVEPFGHLFSRKPDGTLAVDKQELCKPPVYVGMHEWTPGWYVYSVRGL